MDLVVRSNCCSSGVQEDENPKSTHYFRCEKCKKPCTVSKVMPKKEEKSVKTEGKDGKVADSSEKSGQGAGKGIAKAKA